MDKLLNQLLEYRLLVAQDTPTEAEVAHRGLLERMLGGAAPWVKAPPPSMERAAAYPVRFTVPGGFSRGELRSLSGGGVWVATREHIGLGTRVLVRFDDSEVGSYLFPSLVTARRSGRSAALGFQFEGVPERSAFDAAWTPRFRFGVSSFAAGQDRIAS